MEGFGILYISLLAVVGVVQLVGLIIRRILPHDYTTAYGYGLSRHYWMVLTYGVFIWLLDRWDFFQNGPVTVLAIFIIPTLLAIHYWRVRFMAPRDHGDFV